MKFFSDVKNVLFDFQLAQPQRAGIFYAGFGKIIRIGSSVSILQFHWNIKSFVIDL